MSDAQYGYGEMTPNDFSSDTNLFLFMCRTLISKLEIMKLVKVVAVNPGQGSPPAAGTVNVLPLVNQIDFNGYPVKHGTVNGIPYWRFQFGPWAIVADPAVGDVGYVVCADRDSSLALKTPGSQANPGSRRKYSISDGIYIGGVGNAVPAATLWLKGDGTLNATDKLGNVLSTGSGGITATPASGGVFLVNGAFHATGAVIGGYGTADQVGLTTHEHPTAATGAPSPPTPGT